MSKIALPETVKVAKCSVVNTGVGTIHYTEIPIKPGEDEVALLLASKWLSYNVAANYNHGLIWKKSAPKTDAGIFASQSEDIIDRMLHANLAVPDQISQIEYTVYPYPVVLLRAPQLVSYGTTDGNGVFYLFCWYVIQKVTDKALAKLMVKDHD